MFAEYIKKYEKNSILINIIMIVVSVLLILNPAGILNIVMLVFGIGVFIDGIFHIVSYFLTEKEARIFSGNLFEGVLSTVAGILILCNKSLLISMIPIVIGIWILIKSIMKLQLAFNFKSADSKKWIPLLVSSIISILLGFLIILNPFSAAYTVTIIAGVVLLVFAIYDLIESIAILRTIK